MKRRLSFAIILVLSCCFIYAQDNHVIERDSIILDDGLIIEADSVAADSLPADSVMVAEEASGPKKKEFRPDSNKAILYAAVFPGMGQIYNRKYWKLPIVYGGFLGCIYAITWNASTYNGYRNAYNSFTDQKNGKEVKDDWHDYVSVWRRNGLTNQDIDWKDAAKWPSNDASTFSEYLKNGKDNFRRYRDLSIIITVAWYAICIIDAYVDAELFDFDISEDLSLRLDPVISPRTSVSPQLFGLRCSLTF